CLFIEGWNSSSGKDRDARKIAGIFRFHDHRYVRVSRAERRRNVVHERGAHPSGVEYPRCAAKSINRMSKFSIRSPVSCLIAKYLDANGLEKALTDVPDLW